MQSVTQASGSCFFRGDRQHGGGRVEAGDLKACVDQLQSNTAGSNPDFKNFAAGTAGKIKIETRITPYDRSVVVVYRIVAANVQRCSPVKRLRWLFTV